MRTLLFILTFSLPISFVAQDTFSIVALDSLTGEVGSAGASCVDLFAAGIPTDHFIGELFPGLGAINTQAWYVTTNQNNAAERMLAGDSPQEIIDWLAENDYLNSPELRQYGIVGYEDGMVASAGYTGVETDDYKNHITGPGYSIQGNILLGQEVLDSMESRFLAEEGDLACKLMAALQGANMIGADTRCTLDGTSSLFAFVQVADTTDENFDPSFLVSVRTHDGDGIEPIDSLQTKFDLVHNCGPMNISETEDEPASFTFYPNPGRQQLNISHLSDPNALNYVEIQSMTGARIETLTFRNSTQMDISKLAPGPYQLVIYNENENLVATFIKE